METKNQPNGVSSKPRSNSFLSSNIYYSNLTSSLNKRPMGIIIEEEARKKCGVKK